MREQEVDLILEELRARLLQFPNLRVCQLISNSINSPANPNHDHYYVKDDELLRYLVAYKNIKGA